MSEAVVGDGERRGLTAEEVVRRRRSVGPNEVAETPRHPLRELAARFWGPVAWMLEAALLIELVLGKVPEACILGALLSFNAVLAQTQASRASAALELLRHRLRVTSRVLRDGVWTSVAARELVPDDTVRLRVGDIVPADCRVLDGEVEVDQSSLTGESAPVVAGPGAGLYSASTVRRGETTAIVTATGAGSFFGRTTELVRTARSQSHLQRLLFGIVRYLVTLDAVMAGVVVGVAWYRGVPLVEVVPFVLILLIASVPAAMPATFTIANAIESRRLVEEGVLVTELNAVQEAASMDVLCVDKTGTLTTGTETLGEVAVEGQSTEDRLLGLAAAACNPAGADTIGAAIRGAVTGRKLPVPPCERFVPFDPATKRSEAVVRIDGRRVRVVLGSPSVVAALARTSAAGPALERLSGTGARVVAVATDGEGTLRLEGFLALVDAPRPEARELVATLRARGVRVVMLTGDTRTTAVAVARAVGLGERIGDRDDLDRPASGCDGFAGVFPEDKYRLVRSLQAAGHVVGMTGDGVNDAPALKQAEVGIAVSNAADVARASAKLVLTRPGLSDVVRAVESGRRVYRRMLTWTLNKVSKNFEQVFLLTGGFVAAGVFVTSPLLILMLVFANDFVSMASGSDFARPSPAPDRWDVREIALVAAVVGGAWLAVSFGLLWWAVSVAHWALGPLQTLFFVYLVFGSQATLLLVRERGPFWSSRPSRPLLAAVGADVLAVSALAITGVLMPARLSPGTVLGVALAVAVSAVAIDQLKTRLIRWSDAFGPSSRLAHRRLGSAPGGVAGPAAGGGEGPTRRA